MKRFLSLVSLPLLLKFAVAISNNKIENSFPKWSTLKTVSSETIELVNGEDASSKKAGTNTTGDITTPTPLSQSVVLENTTINAIRKKRDLLSDMNAQANNLQSQLQQQASNAFQSLNNFGNQSVQVIPLPAVPNVIFTSESGNVTLRQGNGYLAVATIMNSNNLQPQGK